MLVQRGAIGRMPLGQHDEAGPADLEPFAIRRQIKPDGRSFRDMIEPIHDDSPETRFRSDHRAVENNAFVQRSPVFDRNIASNDGASDVGFKNAAPLSHDATIEMGTNQARRRSIIVVG